MNKQFDIVGSAKYCAALLMISCAAFMGCNKTEEIPLEDDSVEVEGSDDEYAAWVKNFESEMQKSGSLAVDPSNINLAAAAATGAIPSFSFAPAGATGAAPAFNFNAAASAATGDAPAFNFGAAAAAATTADSGASFDFGAFASQKAAADKAAAEKAAAEEAERKAAEEKAAAEKAAAEEEERNA